MANRKTTDLPELITPADGDFFYIVDVSDLTESEEGTSKKVKKSNISRSISSTRHAGLGQTYVIPTGAIALKGWINDGIQHLQQTGFESDLNTFTQSGPNITFKKTITTGQRIIIDYYI